ncbi:unnamed protein product [Brachionus calyciflorus]|uniref:Uncharacterized protein n=1 Tax=Brachionus calyciflorus TaxID=104777 RepID=A0A814B2G6_9BILA|nr:unnamed protein product [Brachionus calyciflorus]
MSGFIMKRIKNLTNSFKNFSKQSLKLRDIFDCKLKSKQRTTNFKPYEEGLKTQEEIQSYEFQRPLFQSYVEESATISRRKKGESLVSEIMKELNNLDLILEENDK